MNPLSVCLFAILLANARSDLSTEYVARNANAILAAEDVPPATPPPKDGDVCDSNSLMNIVCENDRLRFCGPNNLIMSTACQVNGKQGYCNCEKDDCVAERPVCPGEKSKCYSPNTKLPDNLNCHVFSYCNAKGEKLTLECAGNLIYEPKAEKCLDQSLARCVRFDCPRPGTRPTLIPFPQAPNYYVLCFQGAGDVRKCQHKNYAAKNNRCQFDCRLQGESGLFKDTDAERCKLGYYYSCRKSGTNFVTVQARCPAGKTFDETLGLCTDEQTCS